MNAWGLTDKGVVRAQNQGAFYLFVNHEDNIAFLAVCDGMGGARAGDVASRLAIDTFVAEAERTLKPGMDAEALGRVLCGAAVLANEAVWIKAEAIEYAGMGTTLVGAAVSGALAAVINVGDSRAYRISPMGITRVTRDHSLVEDLVITGDLTAQEARSHPRKNLLTRALGTDPQVDCDVFSLEMGPGEFLLLCSDGLTNVVEDQEILYEVLHGGDPSGVCARLVKLACARGGPDNITVALAAL